MTSCAAREADMMKLAVVLITALSLSFLIPAGADATPKGKKIAFLVTSPTHPFIATLSKTFVSRANSFGMEVNTVSQHFDAALQAQQVDDAIARQFDMLAIIAGSEQAIVPALIRAKQAGVPVILVNSPPRDGSEDLYLSFVGEDHVELGRITGVSVLQALKEGGRDGGKIALITGSLQEGVGPRRVAGFREGIAGQLFARFAAQGGLDVVYGMADNQAAAIVQAAKSAGIPLGVEKGKLIVVGSNCLKQGIAGIKAGEQYSTGTQVPTRTGLKAAEMIADHFNGKTLPKNEILPVETITKANVDKWEEACSY